MKKIVIVCSLVGLFAALRVDAAELILYNYTLTTVYVAQVRTVARTDYVQYDSNPKQYDEPMVMPIAPFTFASLLPDTESGYLSQDRVLWISRNLKELANALKAKNRRNKNTVQALYLGSKQQGAKFIAYNGNISKFVFAPSQNAAIDMMYDTIDDNSRYDKEFLKSMIIDRPSDNELIPLSTLNQVQIPTIIKEQDSKRNQILAPAVRAPRSSKQ